MDFGALDGYLSGVAVPVASLRGDNDCGIGEFADLPDFAEFCSAAGLTVLQILPINDTGYDSSPYSALSAYALHPIYLRIGDLPEFSTPKGGRAAEPLVEKLRERARSHVGIAYRDVLSDKRVALRALYDACRHELDDDPALSAWIERNEWVRPYAVFRMYKDRHEQAAWWQWGEMSNPSAAEIANHWANETNSADLRYYAWVQMRLEEQLADAAQKLSQLGVYLKGDLPILMNEDSTDVWLHRDIFRRELRAGAPPDMFSRFGQNWGFPIYNWSAMEENNYEWWRARLRQADKFFHMFRIDHVLGFFRIWSVPEENETGTMGYFSPARQFSTEMLHNAGFDDGRIRWLCEPHIERAKIEEILGTENEDLINAIFTRLSDQSLYLFSQEISGERRLKEFPLEAEQTIALIDLYGDRALVRVADNLFAPTWSYRECGRFQQLDEGEREAFEQLVSVRAAESEHVWEQHGRQLLGFMREEVNMLPCAEDLGVVPDCVPRVLNDLSILGLRVPRWAREWDDPGQPFTPLGDYPYLSVCAASVHDTTTLRGWWSEDPEARDAFWSVLGLHGKPPDHYGPAVARKVLTAISERVSSAIVMYEVQDLFALTGKLLPDDPDHERINTPGTYNEENWSYRIPVSIRRLREHEKLCNGVREVVGRRRT